LFNTFVTNGYQSKRSLKALLDSGLDAMSVDLKGDGDVYKKYCGGANVEAVLRNIETAKKMGIHVEVVNLLITGVNDDEASIRFIIENVLERAGPDTPLHFTRYFPAYEFERPPTKVKVLEKAIELARKEGVKFPYIGNVMGSELESTFCPECGKKVVGRMGGRMVSFALDKKGKCLDCGTGIPLVGWEIPDWE
jgi:pyruvate formate lyase activating enzyme